MTGSVAEHAIPLVAAVAEILVLGLLVAARDAAGVTLGGVHVGATPIEVGRVVKLSPGAVDRSAPWLFAVRVHRSSVRLMLAFSSAYHLPTG
jgi:hypothetical protein